MRLRTLREIELAHTSINTRLRAQQTRGIEPMLALDWTTVRDAGPMLSQHWFSASYLLGLKSRTSKLF